MGGIVLDYVRKITIKNYNFLPQIFLEECEYNEKKEKKRHIKVMMSLSNKSSPFQKTIG